MTALIMPSTAPMRERHNDTEPNAFPVAFYDHTAKHAYRKSPSWSRQKVDIPAMRDIPIGTAVIRSDDIPRSSTLTLAGLGKIPCCNREQYDDHQQQDSQCKFPCSIHFFKAAFFNL